MAISLYDLSVGSYLQVLGAITGVLDKGADYAADNALGLAGFVETRLSHSPRYEPLNPTDSKESFL